jgi:hypothetical protein
MVDVPFFQVLHGAHTAGAAMASRLVVPLAEDIVDRILQGSADAVVVLRRADYRAGKSVAIECHLDSL